MGFNTVAVILNDQVYRLDNDGPIGQAIGRAVTGWNIRHRDRFATDFGIGQVISMAHADYHQIVVVHGNRGCPLDEAEGLDYMALDQMKACLERHGYRVTKRRKPAGAKSAGEVVL